MRSKAVARRLHSQGKFTLWLVLNAGTLSLFIFERNVLRGSTSATRMRSRYEISVAAFLLVGTAPARQDSEGHPPLAAAPKGAVASLLTVWFRSRVFGRDVPSVVTCHWMRGANFHYLFSLCTAWERDAPLFMF